LQTFENEMAAIFAAIFRSDDLSKLGAVLVFMETSALLQAFILTHFHDRQMVPFDYEVL